MRERNRPQNANIEFFVNVSKFLKKSSIYAALKEKMLTLGGGWGVDPAAPVFTRVSGFYANIANVSIFY